MQASKHTLGWLRTRLISLRQRLALSDAPIQLAALAAISGLVTGLVICAFRYVVEAPLAQVLPRGDPENFEELGAEVRAVFPVVGAVLLALMFTRLQAADRRMGVLHVLERLNFHQGYLTLRSALLQFIGNTIALFSGQSVGREGPAVHLGAASGSLVGQWLELPNNSIRTLVGCGTAAAIAAAFNTPMAGVIFAMEVILMEYTIAGFLPIMVAAVSGAVVSQFFYGGDPVFLVPEILMRSQWELPYIAFIGVVIGLLAVLFMRTVRTVAGHQEIAAPWRFVLVGLLTSATGWLVPEVLGMSYDTVNHALLGDLGFWLLVSVLAAKLLLSALAVGVGMPGGLIGPSLVIGATAGGALGTAGAAIAPDFASSTGFYVMLGMGGMMAAVLNAPLAALVALLELTRNPEIILPGMLTIAIANLTAGDFFGEKSIFLSQLEQQGVSLRNNPLVQMLRRSAVARVMSRSYCRLSAQVSIQEAQKALESGERWILVEDDSANKLALLPASDLASHVLSLEERKQSRKPAEGDDKEAVAAAPAETEPASPIDLMAIPARRQDTHPVHFRATLQEALDTMDEKKVDALYVIRNDAPMISTVQGILTREDLENFYRYRR